MVLGKQKAMSYEGSSVIAECRGRVRDRNLADRAGRGSLQPAHQTPAEAQALRYTIHCMYTMYTIHCMYTIYTDAL